MNKSIIGKKYGAFPSDENDRFSWCINCGFSDFSPTATYCEICGQKLFNYCSGDDCWQSCEPYARYCEKCGSPSMLLKKELLWPYTKPIEYDLDTIDTLWKSFFEDRAKVIEDIAWLAKVFDTGDYNEFTGVLTLLVNNDKSSPEGLPLSEFFPKLEWEFSRYLNQSITLKIEYLIVPGDDDIPF